MQKLFKIFLLVFVSNSFTEPVDAYTSKEFSLKMLEKIEVVIDDQLRDGCWTNLGEVKTYTEDKLRSKGATIGELPFSEAKYGFYYFRVTGFGSRALNGYCVGYIELELVSFADVFGIRQLTSVYQNGYIRISSKGSNLNNEILDIVGNEIREMK